MEAEAPLRLNEPRAGQTLRQVLARRVERCGDKPWIVAPNRAYSYREIDAESDRLAAGFVDIGVRPGDTVLYMLPDTVALVLTWCALAKLGAVEVPVNTHLRGGVLAHVINDSSASMMIVGRQFLDRIDAVAGALTGLKRLILHGDGDAEPAGRFETLDFADVARDGPPPEGAPPEGGPRYRDLMAVMYTSGTTGPSKGVMISHTHAYEYALSCVELLELGADDVYYAPLPLFHIAGQWAVVYASCIAEMTVVLPKPFSASEFWVDVRCHGVTCTFLLGAMASILYRQPPADDDADNPLERALIVPLLPEVEDFKQRFGCLVGTTWGSTEINVPTRSGFDLANNRTCGRPADDRYEVRIVDANDELQPPGVPGEAVVRAREPWILMAGYWNDPRATVAAWRNQWLHSGDMLMYDEAGNLYFVDRVTDAIRRRGENVSSMEVEAEIAAHDAVLECAVIPVASEHTEQEVMAVLVLKPGMTIDPVAMTRFLEPRMAYFMVPRYIDIIEAMPKTPTGKIKKFELRERGLTPTTWDRVAAGIKLEK